MDNKYLDREVGKTDFVNFFQKLEHSISIARTHGIITDTEFIKAQDRLVKKFISSLKTGNYSAIKDIAIDFGGTEVKINKNDIVELIETDKASQTVSLGIGEYVYNLKFSIMLNFKSNERIPEKAAS